MSVLELILMFVLQFEGISGQLSLYHRPGHDVTLPCDRASSANSPCSNITWLYNRVQPQTFSEVKNGNVDQSSVRAARLSLDTRCSLLISNITAEDAGFYNCRLREGTVHDSSVNLNILTVSPSPPDADLTRDGEVTLECSLFRYSDSDPCVRQGLRWVNETGAELRSVRDTVTSQMKCVSVLTVKLQSFHNRRFTCQFVDEKNKILIEADYTVIFTEPGSTDRTTDSSYVIVGAVVGLVVLLIVLVAVFIKCRKRTKVTEGVQKPVHTSTVSQDEPESDLTYVTVSHANQRASVQKQVREEENVTYAAVKTPVE
ncbi:uncharacterized protein LOC121200039 [Toxotes jaculatrix]|uniref:uncharacterized protein LOC121200039 n=1 Tax=Toxotes jaculatrix TaxID=941984 RepID=UPI001B3AAF40|nr:uncharacterized protein LOC121200039 [Toxotes jaculatrix]